MEKVRKYGIIAALLILLGLVGQTLYNRTQDGGASFDRITKGINLRNACNDGDKKACEEAKKLEDSK
jgi:hypothetical protein